MTKANLHFVLPMVFLIWFCMSISRAARYFGFAHGHVGVY